VDLDAGRRNAVAIAHALRAYFEPTRPLIHMAHSGGHLCDRMRNALGPVARIHANRPAGVRPGNGDLYGSTCECRRLWNGNAGDHAALLRGDWNRYKSCNRDDCGSHVPPFALTEGTICTG
jgi:hypothetical protein